MSESAAPQREAASAAAPEAAVPEGAAPAGPAGSAAMIAVGGLAGGGGAAAAAAAAPNDEWAVSALQRRGRGGAAEGEWATDNLDQRGRRGAATSDTSAPEGEGEWAIDALQQRGRTNGVRSEDAPGIRANPAMNTALKSAVDVGAPLTDATGKSRGTTPRRLPATVGTAKDGLVAVEFKENDLQGLFFVPERYVGAQEVAEHATSVWPTDPADPKGLRRLPPSLDDVKQGSLGDCWLEAALASIVHTNPRALHDIVIDEGHVASVRLHRVLLGNDSKYTFTPEWVRVEKSSLTLASGEAAYNKGALWPRLIEKAWVAGGFGSIVGEVDDAQKAMKDGNRSYDALVGGRSSHAFEVLLGTPADQMVPIKPPRGADPEADAQKSYTPAQDKLWTLLASSLGAGKMVVAGSSAALTPAAGKGKPAKGAKAETGESQVEGMVGKHAYTVLDVFDDDGERYVRVRNPWGRYAREHRRDDFGGAWKAGVKDPGAAGAGESVLDLVEFEKTFKEVTTHSGAVKARENAAAMKVEETLPQHGPTDRPAPPTELVVEEG